MTLFKSPHPDIESEFRWALVLATVASQKYNYLG